MPWFAWIAIVAIVMFTIAQLVSMATGRPLPSGSGDEEDIEDLRERVRELEKAHRSGELEEPTTPTRAEENLAAEDRWRLDMLEARLESLEKEQDADGPGSGSSDSDGTGPEGSAR